MTKYQFEEISFWLSLIACMLAYNARIEWLTNVLTGISLVNLICAIVMAWKDVKRNASKKLLAKREDKNE